MKSRVLMRFLALDLRKKTLPLGGFVGYAVHSLFLLFLEFLETS